MDPNARASAITEIRRIFHAYRSARPSDPTELATLTDGKLYELFVLSEVIAELAHRGFKLIFVGRAAPKGGTTSNSTLRFKASPGRIKRSDSHFEVRAPGSFQVDFRIFVNIEFDTLGCSQQPVADNSRRHELDIVVTSALSGYPSHDEIALGVECKAVANFHKGLIKEALGVRRELSLLHGPTTSVLSSVGRPPPVEVRAMPPSEFWLAFIDPKGKNYAQSPDVFSIRFLPAEPP